MVALDKVRWTANRLRLMTASEVLYRSRKSIQAKFERRGIGLARIPDLQEREGRCWLAPPRSGVNLEAHVSAAVRILDGKFSVFALGDVQLGFPPQWNRDPETSIDASMAFGKSIDYRDRSQVGNIKTLWEPNRHLELVTLAQAFALTREERFLNGCQEFIESWIDQCPYPLGVNWTSSLELAIRLLNWSTAWHLLGGAKSIPWRQRWLRSIYQHCHFIENHLSRHSSANNHLLGEWMGLLVASLTWPCWPDSAHWLQISREGFEAEALVQNATDGVNREQAVYYHHEVADMMLICGLVGRSNGVEFGDAYWKRLELMMEFVLALQDVGGNVPMIGDADDALMLRLVQGESNWNPYRSLLASCALLFDRADFKAAATRLDGKTRWLLGDEACAAWDSLPDVRAKPKQRIFPEGGYSVLGARLGTDDEIRVVLDSGPLGFLSIAAHGHADALSFTLSAAGEELLIDPGTYSYHTECDWRDWFRSTPAHNTVCVDGLDQSVIGGNFMWLQHASATLEEARLGDEEDVWKASHDGYTRLSDPLVHRREVRLHHRRSEMRVTDTLECAGEHIATFNWHAAEGTVVSLLHDCVEIRGTKSILRIMAPSAVAKPQLLHGSSSPKGGWVSRRFGVKEPTTQIIWSLPFCGTTQWTTVLRIERAQ